jgi:hypothetical protein
VLGNPFPIYRWVVKQVFGYSSWHAFCFTAAATVGFYLVLRLLWRGTIDGWSQQYKGFLVGDLLLAIIAAIAYRLNERQPTTHGPTYWFVMALLGVLGGLLFMWSKHPGQGFFHWSYIDSPTTFYHDFVLFALLIPVLGGGVVPLLVQFFGRWQIVIIVLFTLYLGLNAYDMADPPAPANPPATWSLAHHLGRT